MKHVISIIINVCGIIAVVIGIVGTAAFLKSGCEETMYTAFAFALGGILLPDALLAFFEDEECEDEDE